MPQGCLDRCSSPLNIMWTSPTGPCCRLLVVQRNHTPYRSVPWIVLDHIEHTQVSRNSSVAHRRLREARMKMPQLLTNRLSSGCHLVNMQPQRQALSYIIMLILGCGAHRQCLESHCSQVGVGLPHRPHDGQKDGPLHTIRETCVLHSFPEFMHLLVTPPAIFHD